MVLLRCRRRLGDGIEVRHGLATGVADRGDDLLRRALGHVAFAVGAAAEIVNHDLGALARTKKRDFAPNAAAGAGHDNHLAGEDCVGHGASYER